MSSENTNLLEF
jgi:MFS family permease